jgi:hypothetical protein
VKEGRKVKKGRKLNIGKKLKKEGGREEKKSEGSKEGR